VRVVVLWVLVATAVACGGGLFRQYEYEEEMYLSLDGTATVYVNSSIPALNALRGTTFDPRPNARIDREAVRRYFTSPEARVVRVSSSRRGGRPYVHVRLQVDDVRRLKHVQPFSWSTYHLAASGETIVYRQSVKAASTATQPTSDGSWQGDELVAFRIHVPSVVEWHNAGAENLQRGNIVVWEQTLADRLRGEPLDLEVRMEPQSILYRTLILFAAMLGLVALLFGGVIWWVIRHAR